MKLLNCELKESILSHFTGRILLKIDFFEKNFEIEFLSSLTNYFVKRPYSPDENILEEG